MYQPISNKQSTKSKCVWNTTANKILFGLALTLAFVSLKEDYELASHQHFPIACMFSETLQNCRYNTTISNITDGFLDYRIKVDALTQYYPEIHRDETLKRYQSSIDDVMTKIDSLPEAS